MVDRKDFMEFLTLNAKYNSLLTGEEKTKILKELYASRINALKECNQNIEIDFTELMLKYYL